MAEICAVTGKKRASGNNVSFLKRRTRRDFKPNVHTQKVYVTPVAPVRATGGVELMPLFSLTWP
jgi:ribosomal protein L28